MDEQEAVDVAIVGGGVAGCYLGYRLSIADGPPVVAVYECSDRIGGRLWSAELPGAPGLVADLGGMRFHDELHVVADLIGHLGLASQVADFSFGEPENFAYVRGTRLRLRQLTGEGLARDPDCLPYRLRPGERGKGIDGLLALVTEAAVPGFASLRAQYHAAFAQQRWRAAGAAAGSYDEAKYASRVRGSPLHDTSWWALLCDTLSQEAIHFLQDAGGYETLASCGNAASWLDTIFYAPPHARYRRLTGGYDALPRALHARFCAAGGRTRTRHRLQRFDRAGDGRGYDLVFRRGDSDRLARVRARRIVLTLPPHALDRLDQDTFFFQDVVLQRNLRSVKAIRAAKLFLAYPSAWWRQAGVIRGRSTTDLPIRQLWYEPSGGDALGGPALLLAAYASGEAADYWASLGHGELYPDPPGNRDRDPDAASPRPATRAMVERAHAMAMELHGVHAAPLPHAARFQDWSIDPHGGGWHVWREGYDAGRIVPVMRQPLPDEQVYVASDCWSHDPGSVQGSLSSAECVLQDHLGLPWPGWLRRDGTHLGPRRGSGVDGR